MDEFVPVTKRRKGRANPPCEKESKEMTANSLLSVLDMNYVTYSRKCVQYIFFLVATDLFSS